jgi:hypothetical protein
MAFDPLRKWGIVALSNTAQADRPKHEKHFGDDLTAQVRLALGALRSLATPTSKFPPPPNGNTPQRA